MIKTEITEIKKQFNHKDSAITKLCGCYVDGEKEIKVTFTETFLTLPEEETYKYFEIFKKTLSGTLGKNLLNMDFPTDAEFKGGTQEFLLRLRDSELKDEALLAEFYQKVIEMYDFVGNYLILLIFGAYDVPGKASDNFIMEDSSDEVYRHIICSICPVNLSKPGLSYHEENNQIQKRIQDWVVGVPVNGFLFPAFNDRSTDIHSVLYYSKDSEKLQSDFIEQFLGCGVPMSAGGQKETFQTLVQEVLGDECEYEIVRNIHDKLNEMIEEHKMKEIAEPLSLDRTEVKNILMDSGVKDQQLEVFEKSYNEMAGERASLLATNVVNTKVFEVKTPDVVIKVNPERTDLVETKMVDGRQCIVIAINDQVEVNGIVVKPISMHSDENDQA